MGVCAADVGKKFLGVAPLNVHPQRFARLQRVKSVRKRAVNLNYSTDTGKLSGNMTMSTYYLQGTDKIYSEPVIPSMEMGVDTIFGNLGEGASGQTETTNTVE